MFDTLIGCVEPDAGLLLASFFSTAKNYLLILIGFSLVIFFHELGHFIAAKLCGVRVDKFAVGFGREVLGASRGGTRYSLNVLPLGGYVKMLGQEDFAIDKSGELRVKDDPRAFTHKSVGLRMIIVSAGVAMNLLFAAFVFMLVFMIGTKFPMAEVGFLEMESPAERAGLRVADRIVQVNDEKIADFADLSAAIKLSDPDRPLLIRFKRQTPEGGPPSRHTIEIQPERIRDQNILRIGVAPVLTNEVSDAREDPQLPPELQLEADDEILEVDGEEVSSFWEIYNALLRRRGAWATLKVRRPLEDGTFEFRQVKRRVYMAFRPTGQPDEESGHLLGLVPRRRISLVNPGERADLAGLEPGDVIVRWADHLAPTIQEILTSIAQNPERDIWVEVLRTSPDHRRRRILTYVRPKVKGLLMRGKPKVGLSPFAQENDQLIVADIITRVTDDMPTPAAALKGTMRRGSLITKVNGEPVNSWGQLADRFIELAGRDVTLAWRYEDGPEESAAIYVPHTLGTVFDLPPGHQIVRINGQEYIELERNGRLVPYSASNWIGTRELLRKYVGQTITVEHRGFLDATAQKVEVTVTDEMLDTWPLRITYELDDLATRLAMTEVRERSPLSAMMIGVRKTYHFIKQVYVMMKRMIITRSVDVEQISGPVGIVQMGSEVARQDFVKMLYFLALISANLAVINFLPLPIVDGGLFIFLIIEKIKGSPISVRVQIATQLIGLALIIGIFLFVTINDIQKLVG